MNYTGQANSLFGVCFKMPAGSSAGGYKGGADKLQVGVVQAGGRTIHKTISY